MVAGPGPDKEGAACGSLSVASLLWLCSSLYPFDVALPPTQLWLPEDTQNRSCSFFTGTTGINIFFTHKIFIPNKVSLFTVQFLQVLPYKLQERQQTPFCLNLNGQRCVLFVCLFCFTLPCKLLLEYCTPRFKCVGWLRVNPMWLAELRTWGSYHGILKVIWKFLLIYFDTEK